MISIDSKVRGDILWNARYFCYHTSKCFVFILFFVQILRWTSWGWARPCSRSSLVRIRQRFPASSKMDSNFPYRPRKIEIWNLFSEVHVKLAKPVKVKKLDPRLDPLNVKSHQKKNHLPRLRWEMVKLQGFKVGADTFPVGGRGTRWLDQ